MTRLLVAGSIALDTLEGTFGRVEAELGGSAVYFALAASLVMPVEVVAPVGDDVSPRLAEVFGDRPVGMEGIAVLPSPTYRWHAIGGEGGRNLDLGSSDEIYDLWRPVIPSWEGWAFLGSMRTSQQLAIARQLGGAELVAADSMRSYVERSPAEAGELIGLCDWFFANQEELIGLGGDVEYPEAFRLDHGLKGLCLKAGSEGADLLADGFRVSLPALDSHPVVDTTGAGDALAGGLLARWLQLGGRKDRLTDALAHGIACASLTIEAIGLRGIAAATPSILEERVEAVWESLHHS